MTPEQLVAAGALGLAAAALIAVAARRRRRPPAPKAPRRPALELDEDPIVASVVADAERRTRR